MTAVRSAPLATCVPLRRGVSGSPDRVVFHPGERRQVRRKATLLFGRALAVEEYARLAGAPPRAVVEVGTFRGALYLEMFEPCMHAYWGVSLVQGPAAGPVLVIDALCITLVSLRGRGLGLRIISRQVAEARRLGIRWARVVAGRGNDENGYYTWPRFGFDGPLPGDLHQCLPPRLKHVRSVLDLIESPQGRQWWRLHGRTIALRFDTSPGSRSQRTLSRYTRQRRAAGIFV